MTAECWTLVDCHVHVHPQFDPARLLDAAADNLSTMASRLGVQPDATGVLLLAEMSGVDWFRDARLRVSRGEHQLGRWRLELTAEPETLLVRDTAGRWMWILRGRQIETAERIEVLALATTADIADRMSLQATLTACHDAHALTVLPWGAGKWLGARGRAVEQALASAPRSPRQAVLAGDNGGRPWFWPRPAIFAELESRGSVVLPGTDPLPLADQASRVGTYGLALAGAIPDSTVAAAVKERLLSGWNPETMRPFGKSDRASRFMINQVRLRL